LLASAAAWRVPPVWPALPALVLPALVLPPLWVLAALWVLPAWWVLAAEVCVPCRGTAVPA